MPTRPDVSPQGILKHLMELTPLAADNLPHTGQKPGLNPDGQILTIPSRHFKPPRRPMVSHPGPGTSQRQSTRENPGRAKTASKNQEEGDSPLNQSQELTNMFRKATQDPNYYEDIPNFLSKHTPSRSRT